MASCVDFSQHLGSPSIRSWRSNLDLLGMNYSKWPRGIRGSLLVLSFIAVWFTLLNWVHDGLHNTGAMPPNWMLLAFTEYTFTFRG